MARRRVSTTVADALLAEAAQHRRAEVDRACAAYDDRLLDEPDEWGDLDSFRSAARAS